MDNKMGTQFKRGTLDMILLALIENRGCNYGYSLLEALEETGGDFFTNPKPGTVYPVLYRLEREGYIKITGTDRAGGPSRKLYSVTAKGRKKLKNDIDEWNRYNDIVQAIVASKK